MKKGLKNYKSTILVFNLYCIYILYLKPYCILKNMNKGHKNI